MILPRGQAKLAELILAAQKNAASNNQPGNGDGHAGEAVSAAVDRAKEPARLETLIVTSLCLNPRMLLAKNEAGAEVRCQVRANTNFKARMKLDRCRRDGPTLYTYQGRLPRRKGRY